MFGSIGFPELVLIFIVALLLFGPRKLPEIGRSIGKAMGEFRRASNDLQRTLEEEVALDDVRKVRDEVASTVAGVAAAITREPAGSPAVPAGSTPAAIAEPSTATPSESVQSNSGQAPEPEATRPGAASGAESAPAASADAECLPGVSGPVEPQ